MQSYPLEQLAAFCRQQPISLKTVIVPSAQYGMNLGTALAAAGVSWVNLRFLTLRDLAGRHARSRLEARGLTRLERDARPLLLEPRCAELIAAGGAPYYARVRVDGGFTRALDESLQAMRMAGIDAATLSGISSDQRTQSLAALYRTYEELLQDERLFDDADLFREAREVAESTDAGGYFAILDAVRLSGLERDVLEAVCRDRLYRIGLSPLDYEEPPPEDAAGTVYGHVSTLPAGDAIVGPGSIIERLTPDLRHRVDVRYAVGREAEIRGALREIVDHRIPLDEVEIVYTSESAYLPLLVSETQRLEQETGVQATFAAGIPVRMTRTGQALFAFYAWVASGFESMHLWPMLRSRLVRFESGVDPVELAAFLHQQRVYRGRDGHRAAIERLRRETGDDRSVARLVRFGEAMDRLCAIIPAEDRIRLTDLLRMSITFLEEFAAVRREVPRERRALESLRDRLNDLSRLDVPVELRAGTARLAEMLGRHKIEAASARPGHLHVLPLERAGYSGRPFTFVIGMDEASFPGSESEDPLLLDEERLEVSNRIALRGKQPAVKTWHLRRVLSMTTGKAFLSASLRSVSDGREGNGSALFERIRSRLGYEHERDVPVWSLLPDTESSLTESELLLAARSSGAFEAVVGARFPALRSGADAGAYRSSVAFTAYDGIIESANDELREIVAGTWSASRLESLAACPYRFFLENVLDVEAPDEPEEDASLWLDARDYGSLLHELYCDFMRSITAAGERVNPVSHREKLLGMLDEKIRLYSARVPPPNEGAFKHCVSRLRRSALVFLAEEARLSEAGHVPEAFEVRFGLTVRQDYDCPDPAEIPLDGSIAVMLRGQIDRVDRVPGGYAIWDYKSGTARDYREGDLLDGGSRLQWALYAYALRQMLEARGEHAAVVRSGYYFANEREHGKRVSEAPPSPLVFAETLRPLMELVGSGRFLKLHKKKPCTYCDFRHVCGTEGISGTRWKSMCQTMDDDHFRAAYAWLGAPKK